jgi:hypothetical protein
MELLSFVKASKSEGFVRVRNAAPTRHVERDARPSVRTVIRVFPSMAPTGPTEVSDFGAPILSRAGVPDESSSTFEMKGCSLIRNILASPLEGFLGD